MRNFDQIHFAPETLDAPRLLRDASIHEFSVVILFYFLERICASTTLSAD
jgi:hypothetical protein